MSVDREGLIAVFHAAVAECDPARRIEEGLRDEQVAPLLEGRRRFGVAVGKAALAMARGAGPVERGIVIVPARGELVRSDVRSGGHLDAGFDGRSDMVLAGWRVIESAHPFVDERSVQAAREARAVVEAAGEGDVVLALLSGGASALIEEPIEGLSLEKLGAATRAAMESGVSIAELNDLRSTLSRVKRGGLVAACKAPVVTLAVSDVIGDGLAIIGSGPTIGSWFVDDEDVRRERARRIVEKIAPIAGGLELPRLTEGSSRDRPMRDLDQAILVAPMGAFGEAAVRALGHQMWLEHVRDPLVGDVAECATQIVERIGVSDAEVHGTYVWWGEPTLRVPADHGEGGRAQQLALLLAKALRGTKLVAMAIGSDGIDGPPPATRPAPAGAIVDGTTWDAIIAAGHDPERAIARCDAGTVLDAVGALVVTGPTGINHGDLVVVGDMRA